MISKGEFTKIILESFKEALTGKSYKILFGGSISSFIGFIYALEKINNDWAKYSILAAGILTGSLFSIRFFYKLTTNFYEFFHKKYVESIYAEAIILLKDSFSICHSLRKKDNMENEEFMRCLKKMCDNLKEIFDKLTAAYCCVSIKVPSEKVLSTGDILINLCRDSKNNARDNEAYHAIQHSVVGNSAYSTIIDAVHRNDKDNFAYINNNIPKDGEKYLNTSKQLYPNRVLPYKSELVYPIIPLLSDQEPKHEILGFVCVDCNLIDKFDKIYHVAIVQGVVDGIYDIISKRHHLNETN